MRRPSRFRFGKWLLTGLILGSLARLLSAHDGLEDQIARVTAEIRLNPASTDLWIRRAELYRESRRWSEALADLTHAAALDAFQPQIDFVRAGVLLDSGRPRVAIEAVERFLEDHPNNVQAVTILARAHLVLREFRDADAAFARVVALSPLPELYIERSRALAASGSFEQAIAALDGGIARLGPIVSLELEAIEINLRLKQYDEALARLDRVAAQASRKDDWLSRRGTVLEKAGRQPEALDAYHAALTAIAALPSWTQAAPATASLRTRLQNDIARLSGRPKPRAQDHR